MEEDAFPEISLIDPAPACPSIVVYIALDSSAERMYRKDPSTDRVSEST